MSHELLLTVMRRLPEDYEPWGNMERRGDCSCGCKFFNVLEGQVGADWGVCMNAKSHRAGLLTFEHQGCHHFELSEDAYEDEDDQAAAVDLVVDERCTQDGGEFTP